MNAEGSSKKKSVFVIRNSLAQSIPIKQRILELFTSAVFFEPKTFEKRLDTPAVQNGKITKLPILHIFISKFGIRR
jgi:hypothetical protein